MSNDDIDEKLVSEAELISVYKKRKPKYTFKTVDKGKEESCLADGWIVYRRNKKSTRLAKEKPHDILFEDEVWCLLANMGFTRMNKNRKFKLEVIVGSTEKQIDVFACDEETILIIECKSAKEVRRRTLQKDLGDVNSIREDIRKGLYKKFGRTCKMAWLFATKNIQWSDPDIKRAEHYNISILRDQDIRYFSELTKHIGSSAKYQLLAEVFENKKIPGLSCTVPAIKGKMGKETFYSFAIEPSKLLKIAYVCHRLKGFDDKNLLTYQRMLDKTRLIEIRKYVEAGGLFPNSLVVNLEASKIKFKSMTTKRGVGDKKTGAVLGILELPNRYKSVFIIDGQHRLYGFTDSKFSEKTTLPVIAFGNMNAIKQADLFVDINSKQKRVSRNLLEDLVADTKWGSDNPNEQLQALRSKISTALGGELGSPLYERISASVMKQDTNRPLTIASLTAALDKTLIIGTVRKKTQIIDEGPLYAEDMESTLKRATAVISEYLNIFRNGMVDHWELGSAPGGYLCTNGGITALIYVLKSVLDHIDKESLEKSSPFCRDMKTDELIKEIEIYSNPLLVHFQSASYEILQNYRKRLGIAGYTDCAYAMMAEINKIKKNFMNEGLQKYLNEYKSESHKNAKLIVPIVHKLISKKVITKLKAEYGEDENGWWYTGIPPSIRKNVVQRREDDNEHPPLEQCFDLIHYKVVIEKNWKLFGEQFSRGTGNKSAKMSWMVDLNNIRKKVTHPERPRVTLHELSFIQKIHEFLLKMDE